jgi:isopentenyl-diphosphate delta-isomerase
MWVEPERPSTAGDGASEAVAVRPTAELVVLLSSGGHPIGTADKATIHGPNTPYHLAFSCYAFNDRNELLVTRRAATKLTWPGVWTNSCCGHPQPGEAIDAAVRRRMQAELGVAPVDLQLALPTFSYRAEASGVVEHELCPVFLCHVLDHPRPDPREVDAWTWWSWDRFVSEASAPPATSPREISPWARLQVEELVAGGHVDAWHREPRPGMSAQRTSVGQP